MFTNVSTGFILKFVNSGGKDQVDLQKIVNTLADLKPDTFWQMMEIKGKESDPLELDLYSNPAYVFQWNMTLAFKGGPTHSFLLA